MAIKRVTVEIDDSPDAHPTTGASVQAALPATTIGADQTSSLDHYDDNVASKVDKLRPQRPAVGRTIADIVVEFKDDVRFMTVALFVVSFAIFVGKLDSVANFHLPLLLGAFLNLVWHLTSRFARKAAPGGPA